MVEEPHHPRSQENGQTLTSFIEAARAQGAADEFIYQMLRSRGWSRPEIESAFAQYYERLTGQPVPTPVGQSGEASRDAFLYLLSFATLAIWSQALGQIGFILIDQLIPNPLDRGYSNNAYDLAASIARLIVVFPIYLLLMRLINRDLVAHPYKYQSGVRKWLTYLALFIAALIAIIDVVVFVTSLLQGELTVRFSLQVLIVLVIAGGILVYYLNWLQRQPAQP